MSEFDHNLRDEIEAGEAWLSGMKTPPPSSEAMSRFKAAVRAELSTARPRRGWRFKHWHGALAAAAMITLAVSIGWESYDRYEGDRPAEDQVAMVQAYSYLTVLPISDESDSTADVGDVVDDIAEATDDLGDWSLSGGGLFAVIEDADSEANEASHESGVLRLVPLEDDTFEGVV